MPLHCGHAKGSEFNETLHISPLDPACEARFTYTFDGQIIAAGVSDTQAACMVRLLKLDIAFLRNQREEEIRLVFDPTFLATVTDDEPSTGFRSRGVTLCRATPSGFGVMTFCVR